MLFNKQQEKCDFNGMGSLMQMRRREVGQEEGGGVALSSLQPRYLALCLQWMYRNGEAHTAFSRVL